MRRYPLQPLLDVSRVSWHALARKANVNGPYYRKYQAEGLTPRMADRLAIVQSGDLVPLGFDVARAAV